MKRVFLAGLLLSVCLAAAYGYGVTRREAHYRDLLARGDAAAAAGDLTPALESFSGAIGVMPDSMAAYLKRGEVYARRREFDAAQRDLRRAVELDPTSPRLRELLGDVSYATGRFDRAVERYDEYIALDDSSSRLYYKRGLAQYRAGQARRCVESVRRAIELDQQLPEAHYVLGLCLRASEQLREAAAALQKSLALSPTLVEAREELAGMYADLGRADDRIDQLKYLQALDPSPSRNVALALAHAAVGDPASAVQTLGESARRYPGSQHTYVALGRVWLDLAQARDDRVALGKAIEALQKAVELNAEDNGEALVLLGRARLLDGNAAVAEQVLLQATRKLPVDPAAFLHLASAAERLGHLEVARDALIDFAAVERQPPGGRRGSRLAVRIGDLSMRVKDYAAAAEWYERAALLGGPDADALVHLAEAQWRGGDSEAARATLNKALKISPANGAAAALQAKLR